MELGDGQSLSGDVLGDRGRALLLGAIGGSDRASDDELGGRGRARCVPCSRQIASSCSFVHGASARPRPRCGGREQRRRESVGSRSPSSPGPGCGPARWPGYRVCSGSNTDASRCSSTHRWSEETCRSTISIAVAFCFASLQSMSSPALMLEARSSGAPALRQISSSLRLVIFDTMRTTLRAAWPSRLIVSSTRPAPAKGRLSTATRIAFDRAFLSASVNVPARTRATVRSSSARSISCAISRSRNACSAPWENAGIVVPRHPEPSAIGDP